MRDPWLFSSLLICSAAVAGPVHAADRHAAHTHGEARLTFAADQQQVELMLESPVVNLLGFEHAPATAAEQQAWQKSQALLASGQWLQLPAAAKCQLQSQQLDSPWTDTTQSHADLVLTLRYHCQVPGALTALQLDIFRHAADLQHVGVQWVQALSQGSDQGAATLTPAQPQLRFGALN